MSKWISVKERLPEENTWVDVWAKSTIVPRYNGTRHTDIYYTWNNFWLGPDDEPSLYSSNFLVTHWMPLPEPPQEGMLK